MSHPDRHPPGATPPATIDPSDQDNLVYWRDKFGVTIEQLQDAVTAAGREPSAVTEHFMREGSSAGAS